MAYTGVGQLLVRLLTGNFEEAVAAVMYSTVSVDGFVADENDQVGPLFDWMSSGDVPLDGTGEAKVSQASYGRREAWEDNPEGWPEACWFR